MRCTTQVCSRDREHHDQRFGHGTEAFGLRPVARSCVPSTLRQESGNDPIHPSIHPIAVSRSLQLVLRFSTRHRLTGNRTACSTKIGCSPAHTAYAIKARLLAIASMRSAVMSRMLKAASTSSAVQDGCVMPGRQLAQANANGEEQEKDEFSHWAFCV